MDKLNNIAKMIVNGNRLELPQDEMFKNYTEVKKLLVKAGGKYSKNGFTFKESAQDIFDKLVSGEVLDDKKKYQFFETPPELASKLVEMAELDEDNLHILEPSAGQGAIIKAIPSTVAHGCLALVELMPTNVEILRNNFPHAAIFEADFLEGYGQVGFDRVIANPPFSKNQDIKHVYKMYSCLDKGGILVSVMGGHRDVPKNDKESNYFAEWLIEVGAEVEHLPAGTFKSSETNVTSCIVKIRK